MGKILLASGASLCLTTGAALSGSPTVPAPESYGSAVNANTAAYSFQSTGSARDVEVSFTRNYVGRIFLRLTAAGKAIMFDFTGSGFTVHLVSGVTESAYAPTVSKTLHSQGAALAGTIIVGVSGFDIYIIDDGVEIVRFKSIHHAESGKVACKETLGQTRSAGTVTFAANAYLYSDITAGSYDPRDVGMRSIATTGTISASSTTLTLAASAASLGFVVGDRVIVETGTESGAGARGTKGVGGTWPALSYADATARAAGTPADETFAWQVDTGEIWRYVSGAWAQPYSSVYYYLFKAIPKALQATVTGISGNDLTLSVAATVTATSANVYLDCTPFVNLMTFNTWYKFGGTAGDLTSFQPTDAEIVFPTGTYYFGGKLYLGAFTSMSMRGQGDTTILKSPKGCPSMSIRATSQAGASASDLKTLVSSLKMVGNVRDEGFGLDYANTSTIPSGSGSSGMEWQYNDAFMSETSITVGGALSPGIMMSTCSNCLVEDVTSVDIWQSSVGAEYATDCYVRDCTTTMTDGLRQYIQWCYNWADSTRGAIERCTVTSPRLIAGFEVFRSDGTDITDCVGNNATYSSNSSGNFVFDGNLCAVTVTNNVEATTGFSIQNPMFNINSNIVPPSGAVANGGSIIDCVMTQADHIDASDNSLRGIVINAYNPNITVTGGSYTAPDYQVGSTTDGACGINATGSNTDVTGFTVVGIAKHEAVGGSTLRNINLTGGGGSSATGCTANEIYVNP